MAGNPRLLMVGARGIGGKEGGVEKFAEEFCAHAQSKFDITIITLAPIVDPRFSKVHAVQAPKSSSLRTDKLFYYVWALKECLSGRYDAVLLLGINSAFLSLIIRLRSIVGRRPWIVSRTGSIDYHLPKWGRLAKIFFRFSERMLLFSDSVIAVSPTLQNHLATVGVKSTVIRNGVTHQPVGGREFRTTGLVVAVGRITAQKNYKVLCAAAEHLGEDVEIRIIGGPDRTSEYDRLVNYISERKLSNVSFTGALPRDAVLRQLAEAAVFVNCSIHEGMSNSVLEAIQMGVPLALSDIDANRDLGFNNHFYFAPSDDVALAATLRRALENPNHFTAPAGAFQTWDHVIESVVAEIYKSPYFESTAARTAEH
ncbi:glycosyltransferase family 4 protein [Rhizobium sp. XQZ8]|uniref:glycosyltransferase family 4 protein n=1 Tax=Rhizobium populisoli TaxID=2859785 RepID=UPI001C67E599|nr:glycosyltransferase family 4 protein [Rhizobium populisoli]MBW6426036.1 glycosyltransferase family 4 protein [Rhizobium populisoli]